MFQQKLWPLLFSLQSNLYMRVLFLFFFKLSTLHLKYSLKTTLPHLDRSQAIVLAKPTRTMCAFTFQFTGGGKGPWKQPRDISYRRWVCFSRGQNAAELSAAQSIIRRAASAKVLLRLARNFGNCRALAPCHAAPFKPKVVSI